MRFNHIDAKMYPVTPFNQTGAGKMKRYFYAVEFLSGLTTTRGEPNPRTGRCSQAVDFLTFTSASDRDEWVNAGRITSDMQGNCRQPVTRARLRHLKRGLSLQEFNDELEYSQFEAGLK